MAPCGLGTSWPVWGLGAVGFMIDSQTSSVPKWEFPKIRSPNRDHQIVVELSYYTRTSDKALPNSWKQPSGGFACLVPWASWAVDCCMSLHRQARR